MYAGKTSLLLELYEQNILKGKSVCSFVHPNDNRYSENHITSHTGKSIPAIKFEQLDQWKNYVNEYNVVLIDEVQFFNPQIISTVKEMSEAGKDVILSGLSMDYKNQPFGSMQDLILFADQTFTLTGDCFICDKPSTHTFRKSRHYAQVVIGNSDIYESLCIDCYNKKTENVL